MVTEFLVEGHFARHLRRMRERYGARRAALHDEIGRYLGGALRLPEIQAGLSTPAYLARGITSREVVERGQRHDLDLWALDRYALQRRDLRGLLLGFAAFTERQIRDAVVALASVIEEASSLSRSRVVPSGSPPEAAQAGPVGAVGAPGAVRRRNRRTR